MSTAPTHGWNTATSLRLILTIIPRVPRFLVPAVGVGTTALCLASMKRERIAAARNLRRILGRGGWRLRFTVWSLFYNFSRFMVSYCDLVRPGAGAEAEVARDLAGEARLGEALGRGKGIVVLTAHLGNWEVGARVLERAGAPVHVVMHVDRRNSAERWLSRLRRKAGVRMFEATSHGILNLRAALARNEILAMQGDRAPTSRTLVRELFGAPFPFPLGPFLLAYGCEATLLPAFVVQEGWGRFRSVIGTAVSFPRTEDRDSDLAVGADQYARQLERVVRAHPDQWFNFYELWPEEASA